MKNVLVLGAGLVARPLLRYLLTQHDCRLVVATLDVPRARALLGAHPRGHVVELDVMNVEQTSSLVATCDVVVSLLPAQLNSPIARLCIRHRKHLVNTSYAAPETAALDEEAKREGVLLLCEIGLDPGIDHMSAVSIIDHIRGLGGTVTHFQSCCGGFPAQDANTNPWGYKFSWSPRAALVAGRNPARFLRDGQVVDVPGPELFAHSWPYEVEDQGVFEIYPNRDCLRYVPHYDLEGARGMFRGTIRYPGWCATMKAAVDLGLLDVEEQDWPAGTTYGQLLARRLPPSPAPLIERVGAHVGVSPDSEVIARLEWAGLLSDRPIPERRASPLDVFGNRLTRLMMYQPGERDMVALKHVFTVTYPDDSREEIRSLLVETGEPWGNSAMARTVSLPAAIATRLILDGGISIRGVQIPIWREIYEPVLEELAERGIRMREQHIKSFHGPCDP
jgi:saccharopine dehydrogenase (NADP+, L-glutamate forming)/spermidine synthase